MTQSLISAAAAEMGRMGARKKWDSMTPEQRKDERLRAWKTRRKRKRRKRIKES